jgi:hypothetical protein
MMSRVCNHDHVVQFIGVIMPPHSAVVTKFMACGSVEDLLVRQGPRYRRDRLSLARIVRMAVEGATLSAPLWLAAPCACVCDVSLADCFGVAC